MKQWGYKKKKSLQAAGLFCVGQLKFKGKEHKHTHGLQIGLVPIYAPGT